MICTVSHVVICVENVERSVAFFDTVFETRPRYHQPGFAEYVFATQFRLAFFEPLGKTKQFFEAPTSRKGASIGVTVTSVDACYERTLAARERFGLSVSGPPKEHPWGEKSFLLIDPDGTRFEVTQSPSESGFLVETNPTQSQQPA